MEEKVCKWKYVIEGYGNHYITECDKCYYVDEEELENSYNYCPNCGGKIVVE